MQYAPLVDPIPVSEPAGQAEQDLAPERSWINANCGQYLISLLDYRIDTLDWIVNVD